ncbi:MAG: sulfatase-like hydrolase/transferase, partial [Myxococcales bacterium]|nr:sulfatase-like hydrolase/transferase [Myxococcales bacterium]
LARADTPPSVLIIATDSLRDDRLGVHGATHADITPNIDAFAAGATDLRNMHVATASTLESWYTAFSGRFPPAHGVRWMYPDRARADAAAAAPGLLPRMLSARGWHTAVVSDWAGNGFQLIDQGFAHTLASEPQTFRALMLETVIWSHPIFPLYFTNPLGEWLVPGVDRITKYVRPAALTDRMLGEIDAATRAGRPFFGLVFYSTTHLPYAASYPYNLKYTDPAYRGPHRYEIEVKVHTLIHDGFAPDLPPATIAHIRDLYDGAVSEFDAHVGRLLDGLKARRLDDRTIVIITTDHGEDLYDKGSTLGHGTNFFGGDQSTHIPFLIRGPGLPKAQRVDAITRNVDLAPTLAGLLDVPPAPEWQGVDLGPLLRGEVADLNLLAFAETCYLFFPKRRMTGLTDAEKDQLVMVEGAGDTLVVDPTFDDNLILRPEKAAEVIAAKDRMVRTRRWKLIELPGRDGAIRRLYDLQNDPKQTQNLAGQGRAIERQLAELLDRYWQGDAEDARWPAALEGD